MQKFKYFSTKNFTRTFCKGCYGLNISKIQIKESLCTKKLTKILMNTEDFKEKENLSIKFSSSIPLPKIKLFLYGGTNLLEKSVAVA